MGISHLDHLFSPDAVGVVGRFADPSPAEQALLANLCRSRLRAVDVIDLDASSRPAGLADSVRWHAGWAGCEPGFDLLVSALPVAETVPVVPQAGALGVRAMILTQREPSVRQEAAAAELREAARGAGLRLLGLNSFGVVVPGSQISVSLFEAQPTPGHIALISQSGSLISTILDMGLQRGLGFSHVVSLGSLVDVDFGDIIDYLAWDPAVRCLLLYVENLADVRKFLSACRSAARVKPIVAIKGGRSVLGRKLIAKHTGRVAGDDRVYDTAFRRGGVIRVDTIRELLSSGEALSRGPLLRGDRLGIVSNSGGIGVLVADHLSRRGARIAPLSPALAARLGEDAAPYSGDLNPVCIGNEASEECYLRVLRTLIVSGEIDTLLVVMVLSRISSPERVVEGLRAYTAQRELDVIYIWHGNRREHVVSARRLVEQGHVIYQSVEEATSAYGYALRYFDKLAKVVAVPPRFDHSLGYDRDGARNQIRSLLAAEISRPAEPERESLLEAYGLPCSPTREASSPEQAAAAARELGYPVVLQSEGHDRPGPAGVWDPGELPGAYQRLTAGGEKVLLRRAVRDLRYEMQVGIRTDVEFGPYLFLGPGGPMAGALTDPAVILPPLNRMLARRLVANSGFAERLQWEPAETEQLEEILVRISQLAVDLPEVRELVIDPLTLSREGFLVQASHLVLEDPGVESPHHLATAPYPNQYEWVEALKDGSPVQIRPIRPEDAESHYVFVRGLSSRTIYNRFFGFSREISAEQMVRFTQIDYNREMAIVARVRQGEEEVTIGVNRLTYDPRTQRYEFAVVVADAWQGSGIGRLLMEKIVAIAADRGIETIYGMILATNHPMLSLARKIGFRAVEREEDAIIVRMDIGTA